MTPEQARLVARSFAKLENRLPEFENAIFAHLFEIDPNSRRLFHGSTEDHMRKMARSLAEFIRVQARSHHFRPVTGKGGEAIIPGVGALGARHELKYGVRSRHFENMRQALLGALKTLLGREFTPEVGQAWAEAFESLAHSMENQAGDSREAVAFLKLSHRREDDTPPPPPLVVWSDKLSVHVDQIDNEHKRLVVLLNVLNGAVQTGAGQAALGGVLNGLVHYASYHFSHEEDLFRRSNYPAYEQHLRQHQALTAKVLQINSDFQSGTSAVVPTQVLEFLKNWLAHHIMESDRAFGAYLNANPGVLRPAEDASALRAGVR